MNMRQPQRRRGRGNNNNRTQSNNRNGYDNQNRVDNRARGNAAQMLEKYKKLAQDAQHNDDRVQAEYYHQFADHYFRVLADFRSRQEENRPPQREWRNEERDGSEERDWRDEERGAQEDGDASENASGENASDESGHGGDNRRPQRDNRNEQRDARNDQRDNRNDRGNRPERSERPERNDRPERSDRNDRPERSERNDRPQRSRNNGRNRNETREEREPVAELGLDLSILPPAIGAANDVESIPVAEEKPVRKPRARKPKASSDEDIVAAAE